MAAAPEIEQRDVEAATRACDIHDGSGTLTARLVITRMASIRPRPLQCFRLAIVLAAAIGLAGCAPEDVTPTAPMALDGTALTLEALPQSPCDASKPYAVRVRWSVTDWDTPRFDFHIGSSQGQLWARENRAEGEKDSTPFVTPGMWFVMIDRSSRMIVAATPAPALVCPGDVAPLPAN